MNKDVKYVIDKLTEYSKIPSLTHRESKFMDYLRKDCLGLANYDMVKDYREDCILYRHKTIRSGILVTAHMDRIKVAPFEFELIDNKTKIKGQLDNCISVSICRLLMEKNTPVDFLFTTAEEVLQSNAEIIDTWRQHEYEYVVDMDIDVSNIKKEVEDGAISLRDRDSATIYSEELVNKLRAICTTNKIDFITKDSHWLMCQIGTTISEEPRIKGCYAGLPLLNYHSHKEIMNLKCIDNMIRLFEAIKKESEK